MLTRLTEASVLLTIDIVIDLLDADTFDTRVRCASATRDGKFALRPSPAVCASAVESRRAIHGHCHARSAVQTWRGETRVLLAVHTSNTCVGKFGSYHNQHIHNDLDDALKRQDCIFYVTH